MQDKLITLGDQLEEVQTAIESKKAELADLEDAEAKIYEEILPTMKRKHIEMFRTTSGVTYYVNPGRISYAIKKFPGMKEKAVEWAQKNFPAILTIGTGDLGKICKMAFDEKTLPEFIERKEGEAFLAVRS